MCVCHVFIGEVLIRLGTMCFVPDFNTVRVKQGYVYIIAIGKSGQSEKPASTGKLWTNVSGNETKPRVENSNVPRLIRAVRRIKSTRMYHLGYRCGLG